MKKFWAGAAIIGIAVGIYFFENKKSAPDNSAAPVVSKTNSNAPAAPGNSENIPAISSAGAATNVSSPDGMASRAASPDSIPKTSETQNLPPLTVLDNARVAMKNYGATFGENPVGTNPEITAALMGKNPRGINFITAESGLRVNENGEMVDAWGTPFFFHQLSGHEMEIRSAGEDKKMWTFDDLVTR
jgi:hypothetical protein